MAVYYKFKSMLEFRTVIFDGPHISTADLKKQILLQERVKNTASIELIISNEQTNMSKIYFLFLLFLFCFIFNYMF